MLSLSCISIRDASSYPSQQIIVCASVVLVCILVTEKTKFRWTDRRLSEHVAQAEGITALLSQLPSLLVTCFSHPWLHIPQKLLPSTGTCYQFSFVYIPSGTFPLSHVSLPSRDYKINEIKRKGSAVISRYRMVCRGKSHHLIFASKTPLQSP